MSSLPPVFSEYYANLFSSPLTLLTTVSFLYPLFKAFPLNGPTFADAPKSSNHSNRLRTAAFYVWWVPLCAIYSPLCFVAFMALMVHLGIAEFLRIVMVKRASRAEGEKVRYELKMIDRVVQLVGMGSVLCAYAGGVVGMQVGLAGGVMVILGVSVAYYIVDGYRKAVDSGYTSYAYNLNTNAHNSSNNSKDSNGGSEILPPVLPAEALTHLCLQLFGFLWIAWTMGHGVALYSLTEISHPEGYLVLLLLSAWIGDAAAYYVGSRFGRTKIMPSVSPNKSLEGVVAEVVVAFVLMLGFKCLQLQWPAVFFFLPPISFLDYGVIATLSTVGGIIGDALESLVKRQAHVKDSGTYFTGHGGVLDRFDTFYFNSALVFYYLYFCIL